MDFSISFTRPNDFRPSLEAAGCYLWHEGSLLCLKRHQASKYQGDKWCVPGGKCEPGESPARTAQRELQEETGVEIDLGAMQFFGTAYVRRPDGDTMYHMFTAQIQDCPPVVLDHNHTAFCWAPQDKVLDLDWLFGGQKCVQLCLDFLQSKSLSK